jgi:hypothetical protein
MEAEPKMLFIAPETKFMNRTAIHALMAHKRSGKNAKRSEN